MVKYTHNIFFARNLKSAKKVARDERAIGHRISIIKSEATGLVKTKKGIIKKTIKGYDIKIQPKSLKTKERIRKSRRLRIKRRGRK